MQKKSLCADDLLYETIERNSGMVYRLAFSLVKQRCDADDIYQEVFIRYVVKRPHFESLEQEKAWFIRVTTNLAKNWWKTAWKRKVVSLTEFGEDDFPDRGRNENSSLAEEDSAVIEAVKSLPQKYRVVIHLFYYEEMSVEEIAGLLSLKLSTVRTQLTRARRRLGELLKEEV